MKTFKIENGKEYVEVQGKDLRFLDSQKRTPASIRELINFEQLDFNNQEVSYRFYDEEFINYLKNANYIIDENEFNNMSYEEICRGFNQNDTNINALVKEINKDIRKKKDVTTKRHNLGELYYYQQSILYFIDHKFNNKGYKKELN